MRIFALSVLFALAACGMPTNQELKDVKEKLVEWIREQTKGSAE